MSQSCSKHTLLITPLTDVLLDLEQTASQHLLFEDPDAPCRCSDGTGFSEFLPPQTPRQDKGSLLHHLTMLSLSTAILHQRPLMRAFLFFQKRKTKLRTGKTASQYQLQSMLDAEGWRGHWQAVPWFSSHTLISAP